MKEQNIIKSTDSGRLYVETKDFFAQQEIKDMISKLKGSSIYKKIKERRSGSSKKP